MRKASAASEIAKGIQALGCFISEMFSEILFIVILLSGTLCVFTTIQFYQKILKPILLFHYTSTERNMPQFLSTSIHILSPSVLRSIQPLRSAEARAAFLGNHQLGVRQVAGVIGADTEQDELWIDMNGPGNWVELSIASVFQKQHYLGLWRLYLSGPLILSISKPKAI